MKIYAVAFNGYWPVGAAAVVVAESPADADLIFRTKLTEMKLDADQELEFQEIDPNVSGTLVLLDGNY